MNNIEEIIENLISYKGTLTILVGAGASTEGIKENGEKIPSYTEIKEDILNRYGYHNLTKDELENKFDEFLNKYEKDIQNECETKLVGHPNSVHIEFLSFCLARVRERNGYSTIILTTNYDDLLEDAHKAVCMNDESIKSISFTRDDNHTENIAKIKEQLNNNKVVIAHLWGDLSYVEAVFRSEKMSFQESVKEFLTDIFLNPILSIGYSFQDKPLFEFIDQSTKNPVYVMSKKNRTNHFLNREYITLGYYFSEFMKETFSHINNNNPIKEKYLKYISNHQEFRLYAEEENLLQKLKNINNSALSNLESKIPDGGMDTLIERISVNNSYNDFLKNDSKIFALVGEAGMGKSTYIYYNTMKRYECSSFLTLTIEPESFDNNNSLLEYLSKKFTFKPYLKDTWFSALNAYLELNNLNLLIQIDAINEFTTITPSNLKKEIENLALDGVLRDRIKILFSCREIYWNQMEHNSSNITKFYHHSKIFKIEKYNKEEAPLAFKSYKRAYNLLGEWESLDEHFKEHLSDPLLMNLMARAYNNDTIPKYAPAFSIFKCI